MSKEVVFALQLHLQIIYSNNTSHLLPIIMLRFHEYCKFAHTQSQVRILSTNLEIYLKIIKDLYSACYILQMFHWEPELKCCHRLDKWVFVISLELVMTDYNIHANNWIMDRLWYSQFWFILHSCQMIRWIVGKSYSC